LHLQRQMRYLFPLFFFIGLLIVSQSQGFIPIDEDIVVTTVRDSENNLEVGTIVEISVIVKNFFNNSISNITLTQVLPSDVTLIESPFGTFSEARNYTLEGDNLSVFDAASNLNISLNYLNVTSSNFTLNLGKLAAFGKFSFSYKLNMSSADDIVTLDPIAMTYFDHWGDVQTFSGGNPLTFNVREKDVNELKRFFPEIEVDDNDRTLIFVLILGLTLIALASRLLHLKRPIEL